MGDKLAMLTDTEKTIVNNFMINFQRANIDSDVKFVKARREKDYIRVTVTQNGREDWYHVLGNGTWY
jgi:hypothetical protein